MNGLSFIRRRCNLSQGQLAQILGVTRQAINLWKNRREPLPVARLRQLSDFFGLEPELFGEISEMQQNELLHRVCFLHRDADGHDYYLFRENLEKPIGFLLSEEAGMPLAQDEQMTLDKQELEEILDTIRQSVYPKDRFKWTAADSIVAMNRMRNILGSLVEALEAIQRQPRERKMDCFYLLMQVELALALALGGIEADELPKGNTLSALDSAYITTLAAQFQNRLEEQAVLSKQGQFRYNYDKKHR